MNARLSHIEREVLERAISDSMPIADSDQILATVEAILLSRQLRERRAQPAGAPMPRLRAVGKISPSLRLLRDITGNLPSTTIPPS